MFEFILIKKETDVKHEIKFIEVPNTYYKHHSLNIGNKIFIDFLIHSNKQIDDYYYEDNEYLVLLRGSVFHSEINKPLILQKFIYLNNEDLKQLRGHFNIIIVNKKTYDVKVINDLFGLKPLYYGNCNNSQLISSSLHLFKQFQPEISVVNIIEKQYFHHNLLNHTIFKNIYSLEESSILTLDRSFLVQPYFDWIDFLKNIKLTKRFSYDEFIRIFNKKIITFTKLFDKSLVTLTGGHDGRAVLSGFMKANLVFETFSFGREGSENTKIPLDISKKCKFKHTAILLEEEFENQYIENAILTTLLSDGELNYRQQSTIFSVQRFSKEFDTVFTGLLAGEIAGPVHMKKDFMNKRYFDHIFNAVNVHEIHAGLALTEREKEDIINTINGRILEKRNRLLRITQSKNSHLIFLSDMITWGFRKFYGYQMHLMRYHLENIPVFYDFDLINLLVNSSYNNIYSNSYKSLFRRRNARKLQINIINKNSKCLSRLKLDRGYTPIEAKYSIFILQKLVKYFLRKQKIKTCNYIPDFLGYQWTRLICPFLKNELSNNKSRYNSLIKTIDIEDLKDSEEEIFMISNWIFINN